MDRALQIGELFDHLTIMGDRDFRISRPRLGACTRFSGDRGRTIAAMRMLAFPALAQRRLMLQFSRLEELRPPVLPSVQASAAHTKVGRDLLVPDASLTERTDLFDVFLSELGRLTSASLAAGNAPVSPTSAAANLTRRSASDQRRKQGN
jgi:hypothetical protein